MLLTQLISPGFSSSAPPWHKMPMIISNTASLSSHFVFTGTLQTILHGDGCNNLKVKCTLGLSFLIVSHPQNRTMMLGIDQVHAQKSYALKLSKNCMDYSETLKVNADVTLNSLHVTCFLHQVLRSSLLLLIIISLCALIFNFLLISCSLLSCSTFLCSLLSLLSLWTIRNVFWPLVVKHNKR